MKNPQNRPSRRARAPSDQNKNIIKKIAQQAVVRARTPLGQKNPQKKPYRAAQRAATEQ